MKFAFVALGANLGEPEQTLKKSVDLIKNLNGIKKVEASGLYSTAPIDSSGPDYLNAVLRVKLDDEVLAEEFLKSLFEIENSLGRVRPAGVHNAPRTIDCDLLLFANDQRVSDFLTLPHPRMHQRAFVLVPLLELNPDIEIGELGPAINFLNSVKEQRITKLKDARQWAQS